MSEIGWRWYRFATRAWSRSHCLVNPVSSWTCANTGTQSSMGWCATSTNARRGRTTMGRPPHVLGVYLPGRSECDGPNFDSYFGHDDFDSYFDRDEDDLDLAF